MGANFSRAMQSSRWGWMAGVMLIWLGACLPVQRDSAAPGSGVRVACPQALANLSPAWLQAPTTLDHLELTLCDDLRTLRRVHACLQPGDEIWTFETPPETWSAGVGRAGYAVVRDGQIVGNVLRCAE